MLVWIFLFASLLMILNFSYYTVWLVYLNKLEKNKDIPCASVAPGIVNFLKYYTYFLIAKLIFMVTNAAFKKDSRSFGFYSVFALIFLLFYIGYLVYINKIEESDQDRDCETIARGLHGFIKVYSTFYIAIHAIIFVFACYYVVKIKHS